jgi:hypothetical protein
MAWFSCGKGGSGVAGGRATARAAAAILGEIADKGVHGGKIGGIDELSAQAAMRDETGMLQLLQVKGQRRRRHAEALGDCAGGKPAGSPLDQHAKDPKSVLVRYGAQCANRRLRLHRRTLYISTTVKIIAAQALVNDILSKIV